MQSRRAGFINHRYLRRGFVVFFLLFPWIDFASPQLCDEDLGGLGKTPCQEFVAHAKPVDGLLAGQSIPSIDAYDFQQEQHPEPASSDDDECFCCCAHILPTRFFSVDKYEMSLAASALKDQFLPSPPPRGTYHPPRFA